MTILLGGGGTAEDERPVLDRFCELTADGSVAYVPVALGLADYSAATDYATSALRRPVQTWEDLAERSDRDIHSHAGVFIGGGNTFSLLTEIRSAGLGSGLSRFSSTGVVYGGSAGAIVLGVDIGTAGFFDPNEVDLSDTSGLGLIGPYAVWCHFTEEHCGALLAWAETSKNPVVALTERSGAEVENGVLTSIGLEPLTVFQVDGSRSELGAGSSFQVE